MAAAEAQTVATADIPAIAAAQGAGPALARRLVGNPDHYPHLTKGRSKGSTQVFDLEPLRQALGGSWATYGELIHGIAVRVLARHLGGAYEHERVAERYIVQFDDLSEPQARDRMMRIANGFAEFLFGNANALDPDRNWGGKRKKKRGWMSRFGDKLADGVIRMLSVVGTIMEVNDRAAAAAKPPAKKPNATLRGGQMNLAAPAAPLPDFAAPPPRADANVTLRGGTPLASESQAKTVVEPDWKPDRTPKTKRGVFNANAERAPRAKTTGIAAQNAADKELAKRAADQDAEETATLAAAVPPAATAKAAPAAPVAKPAKPTEITVDKLGFVHRPMWSVRTNMLAVSACYAAGKLPSGELALGESVLPRAATLEVIETVDRGALDHVLNDCRAGLESGRGAIIALPLHYETLADRERRAAYLAACKALPAMARKRLIFVCRNIDREPDQSALIANLTLLKPYATMLMGVLSPRSSSFALCKRAGLASVALDLADAPGSEKQQIETLQQFAQSANQQGLRAAACNLGSMSLAAAAVQAGYDFIEGGILQHQAQPTDVRPFKLEDLYLQYAVGERARVSPDRLLDPAEAGTPA